MSKADKENTRVVVEAFWEYRDAHGATPEQMRAALDLQASANYTTPWDEQRLRATKLSFEKRAKMTELLD